MNTPQPEILALELVIDDVIRGNAEGLRNYFDQEVDLAIGEIEDAVEGFVAEEKIKSFVAQTKPHAYKVLYRGDASRGMQYNLLELATAQGIFMVTLSFKTTNSRCSIQQLRIEVAN